MNQATLPAGTDWVRRHWVRGYIPAASPRISAWASTLPAESTPLQTQSQTSTQPRARQPVHSGRCEETPFTLDEHPAEGEAADERPH